MLKIYFKNDFDVNKIKKMEKYNHFLMKIIKVIFVWVEKIQQKYLPIKNSKINIKKNYLIFMLSLLKNKLLMIFLVLLQFIFLIFFLVIIFILNLFKGFMIYFGFMNMKLLLNFLFKNSEKNLILVLII